LIQMYTSPPIRRYLREENMSTGLIRTHRTNELVELQLVEVRTRRTNKLVDQVGQV